MSLKFMFLIHGTLMCLFSLCPDLYLGNDFYLGNDLNLGNDPNLSNLGNDVWIQTFLEASIKFFNEISLISYCICIEEEARKQIYFLSSVISNAIQNLFVGLLKETLGGIVRCV